MVNGASTERLLHQLQVPLNALPIIRKAHRGIEQGKGFGLASPFFIDLHEVIDQRSAAPGLERAGLQGDQSLSGRGYKGVIVFSSEGFCNER